MTDIWGTTPEAWTLRRKISPYAPQGFHAFLDAGSAGIVDADDGRAVLHGQVHHLADFFAEGSAQGTAVDGEILGKDVYQAAVDQAVSRHHAVARKLFLFHAEIRAPVGDETVEFFKRARVQQQFDAFPGRQFTFFMLRIDAVLPAAEQR